MRMRILSPCVQICPQYDDFSFTNWDLDEEVREFFTLAQKGKGRWRNVYLMLNNVYDTLVVIVKNQSVNA